MVYLPHVAHETEMDAETMVFPWILEIPRSHLPFPHISYLGKKKSQPSEPHFCGNSPLLKWLHWVHLPGMPLNGGGW